MEHLNSCRQQMFGKGYSCSCPAAMEALPPPLPPLVYSLVDIPMRCGACGELVGTATVRWDGAENATLETCGELHEDNHLEGCSIGVGLRAGMTRGVSIDMGGLDG